MLGPLGIEPNESQPFDDNPEAIALSRLGFWGRGAGETFQAESGGVLREFRGVKAAETSCRRSRSGFGILRVENPLDYLKEAPL